MDSEIPPSGEGLAPQRGGGTATTLEWGNGLHGLQVAAILIEPSDLGSGDELMLLPCYRASTL